MVHANTKTELECSPCFSQTDRDIRASVQNLYHQEEVNLSLELVLPGGGECIILLREASKRSEVMVLFAYIAHVG